MTDWDDIDWTGHKVGVIGKRVRLSGDRHPSSLIHAVCEGIDGETLWVCATWHRRHQCWKYQCVVAGMYADRIVKR